MTDPVRAERLGGGQVGITRDDLFRPYRWRGNPAQSNEREAARDESRRKARAENKARREAERDQT